MFTRTGNVIESSEGFAVEVLGMVGIKYRERGRFALVGSEVLARKGIAIFVDQTREWANADGSREEMTPEDRESVIRNIRRALEWAGEEVQVRRLPAGPGGREAAAIEMEERLGKLVRGRKAIAFRKGGEPRDPGDHEGGGC